MSNTIVRTWLLPERIEDLLPPRAGHVESLRARLLDLFRVNGYELVTPPLLEHVESLMTGTGRDLDLRTFKLVDQLSGRMLGLRADITPQVARIDAHLLNRPGVVRLCYAGSVLHTRPTGLHSTREPLQVGAELYGHAGTESDVEVQKLMLESLRLCGVSGPRVALGHVGVFRALVRAARVPPELEGELFEAMQCKDRPGLAVLAKRLPARVRGGFEQLPELYGSLSMLRRAGGSLPPLPGLQSALRDLARVARAVGETGTPVLIDLAELRGYHYHSGVVFAAYADGWSNAVAQGGRYDEIGKAFGRPRAATGFSVDLRDLSAVLPAPPAGRAIRAPALRDAALERRIASLRAAGEIVVVALPGERRVDDKERFDRVLVRRSGKWIVSRLARSG